MPIFKKPLSLAAKHFAIAATKLACAMILAPLTYHEIMLGHATGAILTGFMSCALGTSAVLSYK
jgi:hypothetical protein